MKSIFIILFLLFSFAALRAQSVEDSVKTTVNLLFESMKGADAVKLRSVFSDSAILQTIVRDKEGQFKVRNESVNDFAEFVSQQEKGAADERIRFGTINVDGPLAIVWTPYKFYYKGKFSHCGVNSFHLVRFKEGWRIQYLIDTRRREGCDE